MSSNFGVKLRELRIERGLGLREAALQAGVDAAIWSKYETGARRPPNPASRPEPAEQVIRSIANVLKTETYDPYHDLLALATLPDGAPNETVNSLSRHYARRTR